MVGVDEVGRWYRAAISRALGGKPGGAPAKHTALRHWREFVDASRMPFEPTAAGWRHLGRDAFMEYAFFVLTRRGVVAATAASYVSAMRSFFRLFGIDPPISGLYARCMLRLRQQRVATSRHRAPASRQLLRAVVELPGLDPAIAAASSLAFHALLRVGEYTSPTRATSRSYPTVVHGLSFHTDDGGERSLQLEIPSSKGDAFNTGSIVIVAASPPLADGAPDPLCPVALMRAYIPADARPERPLFVLRDGRPLIPDDVQRAMSQAASVLGIDDANLRPHSWRIGGAVALADALLPDSLVMVTGRWRSDAFLQYTRNTTARARTAAVALAAEKTQASVYVRPRPTEGRGGRADMYGLNTWCDAVL